MQDLCDLRKSSVYLHKKWLPKTKCCPTVAIVIVHLWSYNFTPHKWDQVICDMSQVAEFKRTSLKRNDAEFIFLRALLMDRRGHISNVRNTGDSESAPSVMFAPALTALLMKYVLALPLSHVCV